VQSVQLQIEIPIVSDNAVEKWKEFLKADAVANGGSASTIVRRVFDNRPLKITAFSDGLVVVEVLDGFRLAEELAAFYREESDT
jgi:hypothetical protein